jgi:phosphinothricin acetyltransferase
MQSDFILRPTQEADIPAVAAIYAEAVLLGTASYELEPPSEEEMTRRWRELADRSYPHLVAARDGAVAGFAYAGPYRPRPGYRYLVEDSIYVSPTAQRGGIGRALLGSLIDICEAAGFRQMVAVIGAPGLRRSAQGPRLSADRRHRGVRVQARALARHAADAAGSRARKVHLASGLGAHFPCAWAA